jgi:hypothetical protein
MPIIQTTQEAEAGGSRVQSQISKDNETLPQKQKQKDQREA